jgi:hypothetical protein
MTKQTKTNTSRKPLTLTLTAETIRPLREHELVQVAGGMVRHTGSGCC